MNPAERDAFEGDSSGAMGLSHAADRAELAGRPADDIRDPSREYVDSGNPLLADESWNERENARARKLLEDAGEPLPPRVVEPERRRGSEASQTGRFGLLEDRDVESQYQAKLAEIERDRPDLSYPEQQELAHDLVAKAQLAQGKNAGAYDDVGREIVAVRREHPELSLKECLRIARARVEARYAMGPDAVEKTEADRSRDYLGSSIEDLASTDFKVHSGGGGGNGYRIITNRYCTACDRRYHRARLREGGKYKTRWTPACACGAPYISRQEGEQLMGAKSAGGGSSKGGSSKQAPVSSNERRQANYDAILADDRPRERLGEEERARRAAALNQRRIGSGDGHIGRPLKGSEPRTPFTSRLEPSMVVELHEMTGKSTGDLVEAMHELLSMAKTGVEREAIGAKIEGLLLEAGDYVDGGSESAAS